MGQEYVHWQKNMCLLGGSHASLGLLAFEGLVVVSCNPVKVKLLAGDQPSRFSLLGVKGNLPLGDICSHVFRGAEANGRIPSGVVLQEHQGEI